MKSYIIEGGKMLHGEVDISGSKNASLPIIAATILNGNMISYNNHYYIPINNDGTDYIFYKGTKVEVWHDVFDKNIIRIYKNKTIYCTRLIQGHRIDSKKKEQKRIADQKQLEQLFRERDERFKARAKRS